MIVAAYKRSNRKRLEPARLLGIGQDNSLSQAQGTAADFGLVPFTTSYAGVACRWSRSAASDTSYSPLAAINRALTSPLLSSRSSSVP
jgi:hypothetical protein